MARYVTRVELHGAATWQQYDNLHRQMAVQGFSRYIKDSNNITYELPAAEYWCETPNDRNQVLAAAKIAASAVVPNYSVMVSEVNVVTWSGLKVVS
jgi:hypothetical protein